MKKGIKYVILFIIAIVPFIVNAEEITKDITLTSNITDGIVVKSGNVTINLAGFNVTNAQGEHTIKVEKGATAVIIGNGNVTNNSNKKAPIYNDGTLTIKGGTYYRIDSTGNSYYVVLNHGTMRIDGGTFKIENGISSLIDNGWYSPKENLTKEMAYLTINDGTFNMNSNDKYIKNDDYGILDVNGGEFNMLKPSSAIIANVGFASGKERVTINDGIFNYQSREDEDAPGYAIWDYDWSKKGYTDNSTTIVNGGKFYLTGTTVKGITNGTISENQKEYPVIGSDEYVIVKESEITEKAISKAIAEDDVSKDEKALIDKTTTNKKFKLAGIFNIDLFNVFKNLKLEQKTTSEKQLNLTLKIPTSIEKIKDGYKRVYYVIRIHDGKVTVLDAKNNGNGTISFKSNQFSTYAIAYKDEKVSSNESKENVNNIKNPQTFDSILIYTTLSVISILGLSSALIIRKRFN
ncbi:MAG: hypothetical protein Q4C29_01705 [bacterium]|nr:hypothetical protein [bacterium]